MRLRGLAAGLGTLLQPSRSRRDAPKHELAGILAQRHDAAQVILTDSGTSALVLALQAFAGRGGMVAMPGYGCVDLTAAAVRAGVRVRLYDVEPATLTPDEDSVARVLRAGVDALLVAHLYGMPADMVALRALADAAGVPVIEDAAQAGGGSLRGRPLGGFGDLAVLSFGRGKGTTGGAGGALLVRRGGAATRGQVDGCTLTPGSRGSRALLAVAAQWALARPSLYALPAAVPWLRLGEMVYHPAGEPRTIAPVAAAVTRVAHRDADRETAGRRACAARLRAALRDVEEIALVAPVPGADPGYLRLPLLGDVTRHASAPLGILRAYPQTLREHMPLAPLLADGSQPLTGASELARRLLTVPTHGLLRAADERAIVRWFTAGCRSDAAAGRVTRRTFPNEHVTAL